MTVEDVPCSSGSEFYSLIEEGKNALKYWLVRAFMVLISLEFLRL